MRRARLKFVLMVGFVVAFFAATPCSELRASPSIQTTTEPSRVAVVSAFSRELTPLIAAAEIQYTKTINGRTYNIGRLAGSDVVLVLVGVGLSASGWATQTLIDSFDISAILFSGIAGGINPDLRIGDVTIPARWRQADIPAGAHEGWIDVDPELLAAARTELDLVELDSCTTGGICLGYGPEIVADGNGISNPYFVDDSVYRNWLWNTFQADVVDMETSSVAAVAGANQIPFLAVRCISDLAGGAGNNQINTYLGLAADNAAAVANEVLDAWSRSLDAVDMSSPPTESYSVLSCYPNPFNISTTIVLDLPQAGNASLIVYNLLGREVVRLTEGHRMAGRYKFHWESWDNRGRAVPAGIYIGRLATPGYSSTYKMLLLK